MKIIKPEIAAGPWSVDGYGIFDPTGDRIATVNDFGRRNPRGDTQAIAALPDVLEALQTLVKTYREDDFEYTRCFHQAKQSLVKAGYKFEES